MGLAASQARLLSLTARIHDIEYKAQNLQAQKLQLANQTQKVYDEYEDALNSTKVQYKVIGADGSALFKDATLYNLVTATGEGKSDYIAHNIATNQMYATSQQINKFITASTTTGVGGQAITSYKLNANMQYVDSSGNPIIKTPATTDANGNPVAETYYTSPTDGAPANAVILSATGITVFNAENAAKVFAKSMGWEESNSLQSLYYEMLECVNSHGGDASAAFIAINAKEGDLAPDTNERQQFNSTTYLTNMLKEGFIVLHKMTGKNESSKADEVNIATDTALQEVSDQLALKKAEAKYEADMRKIDAKDKKFDVDIAALEAERNALKTEMETLKTVAKDNVERTFKLFS